MTAERTAIALDADPLARFRLRRCVNCHYDLVGLPPEHCCPECGEAYTRDTLLLVGWSGARFVGGTGMWFLRFLLYPMLVLLVTMLVWPAGLVLAAWFIWSQFIACANQRLLVTDAEIRRPAASRNKLKLLLDTACYPPSTLGRELRHVRLRRCRSDLWELLVHARSRQRFFTAGSVRVVLLCDEDEARALAHELRLRIARAIELQKPAEPPTTEPR